MYSCSTYARIHQCRTKNKVRRLISIHPEKKEHFHLKAESFGTKQLLLNSEKCS